MIFFSYYILGTSNISSNSLTSPGMTLELLEGCVSRKVLSFSEETSWRSS